jgi:hypothetical protein
MDFQKGREEVKNILTPEHGCRDEAQRSQFEDQNFEV